MITATVEIEDDAPDLITVDCSFHVKDIVKKVPGARWNLNGRRAWTVPLSWGSCLALRSEFGTGLVIGPKLKAWAANEKIRHDRLVHQRTQLRPTEQLLEGPEPGWEDLFPYQAAGAELISLAGGKYMLFDETGVGKTRTALAGVSLLEDPFPLLVVAPKSMLLTWKKEIEAFFCDEDFCLDIRVVTGTPKKREAALAPGGSVYIISYGSLNKHSRVAGFGKAKLTEAQKTEKELNAIDFRTVIADEAHRAKSPQAVQTRALWGAAGNAAYRIPMTGTPVQENAEDMWALYHFMDPDRFSSKSAYVERFLDVVWNQWGGREIAGLREEARDEFFALIDSTTRRMTKDAALPFLPPKVREIRWVELPAKMRKAYDSMQKNLIAELEAGTIEAGSVLERATRLLQLANASGEIDADGVYRMQMPSPKLEAFIDDLQAGDWDGESIVIFSESRQLADLLCTELARLGRGYVAITGDVTGDDRQKAMESFQAGEVPIMVLTRAGGEGITLTRASTMVRLVRSWSHTVHKQSEDRVHRIGSEQHDRITYVDYIVADTVEETQLVRLNSKEANAQEILRDAELLEMLKR